MKIDNPCFAPDLGYDVPFIVIIDNGCVYTIILLFFWFHFVSYLFHLIFAPLFFLSCHIYLFTFWVRERE